VQDKNVEKKILKRQKKEKAKYIQNSNNFRKLKEPFTERESERERETNISAVIWVLVSRSLSSHGYVQEALTLRNADKEKRQKGRKMKQMQEAENLQNIEMGVCI
jgi:uncharacterized protein with von Willebrand factor type A (vWA) domain